MIEVSRKPATKSAEHYTAMAHTMMAEKGITRGEALRLIGKEHPESREAFKAAGRARFPQGLR